MAVTCNKRKSTRCLWLSLISTTLVACGTLVYISLLFGKDYHSEARNLKDFSRKPESLTEEKCISVCDTEECVLQTNFLLNQVETAADPCENFFEFACGKYVEKFWNESRILLLELFTKMKMTLRGVLENIDADPGSASGKLKIVYDSCIKHSSSDFQAIPTLLQYLNRFGIPNWPHLEPDFKFVEPSLLDVLSNFLTYQEYGFINILKCWDYFGLPVIPCLRDHATIIPAESTYEKKDNSTRKYLVERVLQYFNFDSEAVNEIWQESEAIREAIIHLKEESEQMDHNLEDRLVNCPEIETKWKPMCEILKKFVDASDVGEVISEEFAEIGGHFFVHFIQNFIPVLSNFSDRSIANYLALNLLFNHLDELNFYFQLTSQRNPDSNFYKIFRRPSDTSRWNFCIEWLTENMFLPFLYVNMEKVLTEPVFQEAEDLIEECIRETADAISNQEGMIEAARIKYGRKTGNITNKISKAHVLRNEAVLNNLYDQFHPTAASFLQNAFEHRRFFNSKTMLGSLDATNLSWFRSDHLWPVSYGDRWFIDIPPGALWPPIFRSGIQRLINLVTLAVTAGHEVGHSLYSEWRTSTENSTEDEYVKNIVLCIENQYSQFKFKYFEKNMEGEYYNEENFGDTIGISIIDKFIEKYASEDAFLLPGFPYSMKQLLYISAAQTWCGSFTEEDEETNIKVKWYSLGNFRILGMMQNSKGFAKAFSCPEGSFMNPSTKCAFPG